MKLTINGTELECDDIQVNTTANRSELTITLSKVKLIIYENKDVAIVTPWKKPVKPEKWKHEYI